MCEKCENKEFCKYVECVTNDSKEILRIAEQSGLLMVSIKCAYERRRLENPR